jgi:hypothetical protein
LGNQPVSRSLALIAVALVWIAASIVLSTATESTPAEWRIGAGVIVGLPSVIGALWIFSDLIGKPPNRTRVSVKRMLKAALVEMHRNGSFRGDISQVSMHVWSIPLFWRVVVPVPIKKRQHVKSRTPNLFRARLIRLASYRLDHHGHSNFSRVRKGTGLVGRCAQRNNRHKIHIVRFYTPEFQQALLSDESWYDDSSPEINQRLKRELGKELAERYSQAAALVLQVKGCPIGCITLELPPQCTINLPDNTSDLEHDPRIEALRNAASLVERELTFRP